MSLSKQPRYIGDGSGLTSAGPRFHFREQGRTIGSIVSERARRPRAAGRGFGHVTQQRLAEKLFFKCFENSHHERLEF